MLQNHPSNRDWLSFKQGEIRDPEHASPVLLQKHHRLGWAMQCLPLLDAALQGAFAPVPLLSREGLLQMQQQGLGFKLRSLLEHGHQNAVPDLGKRISAGAPMTAKLLLLALGL